MSNLIKYPFVNLENKDTYMIDYEKREREKFVSFSQKKMDSSEESKSEKKSDAGIPGQFESGVPVKNYNDVWKEQEEEAEKRAKAMIEDASQRAEQILREAEEQVELLRERAREEGLNQGFEEGMAKAEEELSARREQMEEERAENEKNFQQMLAEIEPKYADVLCSLLQKLTGVIVNDKKDVLLHLIRSSIVEMDAAKQYTIRVSSEDLMFVENHKDEILMQTGAGVVVDIQEEKGLAKEECIIETDTQMIDCGFRTQLDNLIMTLRMLAG